MKKENRRNVHFAPKYHGYQGGYTKVSRCQSCGATALREDMHPASVCPICGGVVKDNLIGKWTGRVKHTFWLNRPYYDDGNWRMRDEEKSSIPSDMNGMGKPVHHLRRQAGNDLLVGIGVEGSERRHECIREVAGLLERDRPDEAMATAEEYIDTTGAYMLIATLLVQTEKEKS